MAFESEDGLYAIVVRAFEKYKELYKNNPANNPFQDGKLTHSQWTLDNGQVVYFVGEEHGIRQSVDYIHNEIVPKIKQDPKTWLILREKRAGVKVQSPMGNPPLFYSQELAKFFKIPYIEALTDLYAPDTRAYIQAKAGINGEDIDRIYLTMVTQEFATREEIINLSLFAQKASKVLKKRVEHALMGPVEDSEQKFRDLVITPWNEYSRERFHRILKQYPNKSNILVCTGSLHLSAFQ